MGEGCRLGASTHIRRLFPRLGKRRLEHCWQGSIKMRSSSDLACILEGELRRPVNGLDVG